MAGTSVTAIRALRLQRSWGGGHRLGQQSHSRGSQSDSSLAESPQVPPRFRGRREGWSEVPGSSSLEKPKWTQGPGLRKIKRRFCSWLHIPPGEDSLQPPEGMGTVTILHLNDLQSVCTQAPPRALQRSCRVKPGGESDQPILLMGQLRLRGLEVDRDHPTWFPFQQAQDTSPWVSGKEKGTGVSQEDSGRAQWRKGAKGSYTLWVPRWVILGSTPLGLSFLI